MKLGFIGLGTMGAPMAINLLKAGFQLKVYDIAIESERVRRVVNQGAELVNGPRDVAPGSEFILLSLPSPAISEKVTLGEGGILQSASPGTTVIELSTISPQTVKKIAKAAEPLGIDILDAPVSGGQSGAEAATLTIMVGGKRGIFEGSIQIFKAIGKRIYYTGDLGSGETVKLLNNMRVLIDLVTSRSVFEIAVKAGIDPKLLHEIINTSTGQSWVWANWIPRFLDGQSVGSTPDIFNKDMTQALEMAREFNLHPEIASAALEEIRSYVKRNMGGSDISTMFDFTQRPRTAPS